MGSSLKASWWMTAISGMSEGSAGRSLNGIIVDTVGAKFRGSTIHGFDEMVLWSARGCESSWGVDFWIGHCRVIR